MPPLSVWILPDPKWPFVVQLENSCTFSLHILASLSPETIQKIEIWLEAYTKKAPLPPAFLPMLPGFSGIVLQEVLSIPIGSTCTYGQIAHNIGASLAARAVGQACHRNPFPFFIPCHRVVQKKQIGGFAFSATIKKNLLDWEASFT